MAEQRTGEGQRYNATLDHYASMLERGRILIIDYDVTRYHSFDLFRYLLLDHDNMQDCNNLYLPMIAAPMVEQQLVFYYDYCPFLFPYDNFISRRDSMSLSEMELRTNELLAMKHVPVTETSVASQFNHLFERADFDGYMLRYRDDPHHCGWENQLKKVYQSDRILDTAMARTIIKKKRINMVITASVDVAVIIASNLKGDGINYPMSFLIGSYRYNMNEETRVMRHLPDILLLERVYKHEFGIFQPFGNLEQFRQELKENFEDDEH